MIPCFYKLFIYVLVFISVQCFKPTSIMKLQLAKKANIEILRKITRLKVGDYASEITNAVGAEIYGGF